MPDVEHMDRVIANHEQDLVGVEKPLPNGFGEEAVFVRQPALPG
jgi:hypothetical protein